MSNQTPMKNMYNISQNVANSIYAYSYIALVIGAIITLAATIGIMYSGPIRERYTSERIADNERQTTMAKTEAARANENAAIANENAAK
jgi:ABC-type oligopeptide transport system ATPase subunit